MTACPVLLASLPQCFQGMWALLPRFQRIHHIRLGRRSFYMEGYGPSAKRRNLRYERRLMAAALSLVALGVTGYCVSPSETRHSTQGVLVDSQGRDICRAPSSFPRPCHAARRPSRGILSIDGLPYSFSVRDVHNCVRIDSLWP